MRKNPGLEMDIVMMEIISTFVTMMVVIAVDQILTKNIVQNVYAIKKWKSRKMDPSN